MVNFADSGTIKVLFLSMLVLVVLGWVVNLVTNSVPMAYGPENTVHEQNGGFDSVRLASTWENDSLGDNNNLYWDNFLTTTDNAVWDNVGATNSSGAGLNWTRWYQTVTVPAYSRVVSARISGEYTLSDNTEAENIALYVMLQRPGGDNVTVLEFENTAALWVADNHTFTTFDNIVTTSINASGAYILYLHDNVDRLPSITSENWRGFVWDDISFDVVTQVSTEYTGTNEGLITYGPTIVTMIFIGLFILAVVALIQYLRI